MHGDENQLLRVMCINVFRKQVRSTVFSGVVGFFFAFQTCCGYVETLFSVATGLLPPFDPHFCARLNDYFERDVEALLASTRSKAEAAAVSHEMSFLCLVL